MISCANVIAAAAAASATRGSPSAAMMPCVNPAEVSVPSPGWVSRNAESDGEDGACLGGAPSGDECANQRRHRAEGAHRLSDADRELETPSSQLLGLGVPAGRRRGIGADGRIPGPQLAVIEPLQRGQHDVCAGHGLGETPAEQVGIGKDLRSLDLAPVIARPVSQRHGLGEHGLGTRRVDERLHHSDENPRAGRRPPVLARVLDRRHRQPQSGLHVPGVDGEEPMRPPQRAKAAVQSRSRLMNQVGLIRAGQQRGRVLPHGLQQHVATLGDVELDERVVDEGLHDVPVASRDRDRHLQWEPTIDDRPARPTPPALVPPPARRSSPVTPRESRACAGRRCATAQPGAMRSAIPSRMPASGSVLACAAASSMASGRPSTILQISAARRSVPGPP